MTTRYLHSDTDPVMVPIATGQAVDVGDLSGLDAGTLVRAEDTTWDTNLATTQTAFVAKFLGVSGQKKAAGTARIFGNSSDNICRVDSAGIYEFSCASATFAVGDLVGPAKQSGNALESQKVVAVAYEHLAIGRVVEAGASITKVKVRLLSMLMPAARQNSTASDDNAAITSLTDNTGGSTNDTLTALGGITTLTDSTGLSGSHDDTLAAVTTFTPSVAWNGSSVYPSAADATAIGTAITVLNQNASDTAQKVIELVADMTDAQNNFADCAAKINAILAALRVAGIIAS